MQLISPAAGFNSGLYRPHQYPPQPWNNPDVRRAASMAIDRESMSRSLFGYMVVQSNPLEVSPFFNADAPSYNTRDLDGAKALMEAAGLADGVDGGELIVCGLGFQYETLAQLLQLQLADIGIDIDVTVLDVGTYVARTLGDDRGDFDLAMCGMVPKPDEYDLINHPTPSSSPRRSAGSISGRTSTSCSPTPGRWSTTTSTPQQSPSCR